MPATYSHFFRNSLALRKARTTRAGALPAKERERECAAIALAMLAARRVKSCEGVANDYIFRVRSIEYHVGVHLDSGFVVHLENIEDIVL